MTERHFIRWICALLLLGGSVYTFAEALAEANRFDGHWRINYEETDKVAVKYKDGSGVQGNSSRYKPTINVGLGLPMPQRMKQPPMSDLAPHDPDVLRCSDMHISTTGKKIRLDYDQAKKEILVNGDYRGRTTSISKKHIQQKYKTTERKVTKTWSIREDGRLLVSVKLNPRKDKARTYNRVFDRVVEAAGEPIAEQTAE